ncbi:universal stress protein UspA [Acuticoccus sediminis]|uniref:Universal stress protein UspA n=1 Tax=Acuticoccus sediminis TaxID=2184697 RepID=A0A8B2NYH7_9HYPH|nr:universal stress protein [Acuticoccus sediminis]RAI03195.1 universal stress protein UspA [Acuticoccus sediminis]
MFKRILVPCDGSTHASQALEKAVELQKLTGSELLLLTVYRHYSYLESTFSMVRPSEPESMDDVMREYAEDIGRKTKERAIALGADRPRGFVKNGPVARSIVAFAEEHGCDLVVIGKRGLGSIEEYLLGSVSHKVTGLARCPVLVV